MNYLPYPDAWEQFTQSTNEFAAESLRLQAKYASGALALLNLVHVLSWADIAPVLAE